MTDVGIDTNILAYAEGFGDVDRVTAARDVLSHVAGRVVVSTQVLGELYNVLVRKAKRPPTEALASLLPWQVGSRVVGISEDAFWLAASLASARSLQIWDALIVVAAEAGGCAVLLSEDMQHGFRWRRLTVVNPFIEPSHPLITGQR